MTNRLSQTFSKRKRERCLLPAVAILALSILIEFAIALYCGQSLAKMAEFFSLPRCALILMLLSFLYAFRPKSSLFSQQLDWSNRRHKGAVLGLALAISLILPPFSYLTDQQGTFLNEPHPWRNAAAIQDGSQYNYLADALLSGHAYLDLPVSDILSNMENPYDPQERVRLNGEAQEPIYWDYAFYKGKYYCYFGVLPCLLTFVPFKALTGMDLRTDYVVVLFGVLVVWGLLLLLRSIQRLYFNKCSLGAFVIGYIFACATSGLFEQVFLPRIYPIPILASFFFASMCLFFWFEAKRKMIKGGGHPNARIGVQIRSVWIINRKLLVAGAICAGCTLGCRPQEILVTLLAIPLFWNEIREREFFSRKGIRNTLAVILPIVVIAIPQMLYNYIRFESPFDFGATYNLTGGDMTNYSFSVSTIAVRFLECLFLPLQLTNVFPYVQTINDANIPFLHTPEPVFAGFMMINPGMFFIFLLVAKKWRAVLKGRGRELLPFAYLSMAIAAIIIVIAVRVSGVNMRYFMDFSLYLITPCLMCFWSLSEVSKETPANSLFAYLTLLGAIGYSAIFLSDSRFGALSTTRPHLYNTIKGLFVSR